MGKTSYKNTKELIIEVSNQLDKLDQGSLELDELNRLVECGQEIYEQLVILRYKAFDKFGEQQSNKPIIEKTVEPPLAQETEAEAFDFTEISSPKTKEEPQPSFDFSIDTEIDSKANVPDNEEKSAEKQIKTPKEDETDFNSLNDVFKSEDDLSLRKKFQNTPVADIKSNISIAKKFEYISNMFDGNSSEYEESIDFLNTCASGEDARLKLNELTSKYKWDLEDKSIIKFIELVERRYL